ncbi:hypothetical protein FBUS_02325 [Fasciolopsis buskii]|uniref:Uncharacterized protein n=1 Tax=Fasciolopsis buskii TaxID=27845 RepID=A0A8E0VFZ0_9TREM|nr:hypothetical protein FBUS_02325 [Fasciolopsis buski]
MIPSGYPFASLLGESLSVGLPLPQASLGGALFGQSNPNNAMTQLFNQAVLQNTLGVAFSPLTPVISSSAVHSAGQAGVLPGSVQLSSVNQLACINPLALYSPMAAIQPSVGASGGTTTADVDAHTIVRAPVLYKKSLDANEVPSSGSDNTDTAKTCTETSPPDRIVASYAAAAHAAALANHQPVSKAAEVFLAATSNTGRSRHPKRSRPHGTTGVLATHSDPAAKRMTSSCGVSSLLPTSTDSGSPNGVCLTNLSSDGPDGISLNNTAEVCAYLRTRYPNAAASKSYEDLVASRFVFEPTTDAPSLDNGLNFIAPVQSSASEEPPNVTSTSVSCGSKYSSICRIALNPSVARTDGSKLLTKCSGAESSTDPKTISSQPTEGEDPDSVKETSRKREVVSSVPPTTTVPQATPDNVLQVANVSDSDATSNPTIDELHAQTEAVNADARDTPDVRISDALLPKGDKGLTEDDSSGTVNPSNEPPCLPNDVAARVTCDSNPALGSAVDSGVARMSTETLTTGILNTTIPSCSSAVIPPIVPPGDDISLLTLNGLTTESPLLYPCGNAEVTSGLSVNSLLSNPRLTQAQVQQQQLSALISALSTGSTNPQSNMQASATLIGPNMQLNPLNLLILWLLYTSFDFKTDVQSEWLAKDYRMQLVVISTWQQV